MSNTIKIYTLLELGSDCERYFQRWAKGIEVEKHMVNETPEDLEKKSLEVVFAIRSDYEFIGASAIMPARTRNCGEIIHGNLQVVELGSNFIEPEFRNQGIGEKLLLRRLELSFKKKWFPVSVTTNPAMQHIFKKLGAVPMDDLAEFKKMRKELCICKQICESCLSCPLKENAGWFFPKTILEK